MELYRATTFSTYVESSFKDLKNRMFKGHLPIRGDEFAPLHLDEQNENWLDVGPKLQIQGADDNYHQDKTDFSIDIDDSCIDLHISHTNINRIEVTSCAKLLIPDVPIASKNYFESIEGASSKSQDQIPDVLSVSTDTLETTGIASKIIETQGYDGLNGVDNWREKEI